MKSHLLCVGLKEKDMQKRTGSVLWGIVIVIVISVCGLALTRSSGAAGPITAMAAFTGLVSTFIVRGVFKQ